MNRVTVTACCLGLVSLVPDWFTLRPNRLVSGTGVRLEDGAGGLALAAILIVWLACLVLSALSGRSRVNRALTVVSGVVPGLVVFLAGLGAHRLAPDSATSIRVSAGAGLWLALFAAYVLVYSSRKGPGSRMSSAARVIGIAAPGVLLAAGWVNDLSVVQELLNQSGRFRQELIQHVRLGAVSVSLGALLGIPLGVWAVRSPRAEAPVFFLSGITQTIPSLALFGLLIAPLSALSFAFPALREIGVRGVGATPALIALTIYSLLPIVRNTFVSLRQVAPALVEAGLGMGMSRGQVFRRVEAPLAAPLVVEGIRIASVQAVGNTAVAALIGAGGLGWFIFQGFGQAAPDVILVGAIPIIALAVLVDALMRLAVRAAAPRGQA